MSLARHRVCGPWTLGISAAVHGGAVAALLFAMPLEARVQEPPGIEIALISPAAGLPEPEPAEATEPEEAPPVEETEALAPIEPPPDVALTEPPPKPVEPIEPEPPDPVEVTDTPPPPEPEEPPPEPEIVETPPPEPDEPLPEPEIVETPPPEPELITAEAPKAVEVVAKPPPVRVAAKTPTPKPQPVVEQPPPIERETPPPAPPPAAAAAPAPTVTASIADTRDVAAEADLRARYMAELRAWLEKHKRYPRVAQRQRSEGTALLAFVMSPDGRVLSYEVRKSSGHAVLDDEVRAMIERAAPLPPIPPELERGQLEVVVPVKFSVR